MGSYWKTKLLLLNKYRCLWGKNIIEKFTMKFLQLSKQLTDYERLKTLKFLLIL